MPEAGPSTRGTAWAGRPRTRRASGRTTRPPPLRPPVPAGRPPGPGGHQVARCHRLRLGRPGAAAPAGRPPDRRARRAAGRPPDSGAVRSRTGSNGPCRTRSGARQAGSATSGPERWGTAIGTVPALIVVGTRRRHGHTGVRPNGVAHALLLHASCPVAVVPEHS
ncbi:universal stress protein [Streptomyces griseoviridis]